MAAEDQEIIDLEKRYWDALKNQDTQATLKLTADPCLVTGAQGVDSFDHNTMVEMVRSQKWILSDYRMSDIAVERVGDDVAIIAYKVHEDMTVEGKPLTLEAADASTWVKRGGRWQCVLHTESLLGDPFDRKD
jgi:ketosteroid isomerase-like protein